MLNKPLGYLWFQMPWRLRGVYVIMQSFPRQCCPTQMHSNIGQIHMDGKIMMIIWTKAIMGTIRKPMPSTRARLDLLNHSANPESGGLEKISFYEDQLVMLNWRPVFWEQDF